MKSDNQDTMIKVLTGHRRLKWGADSTISGKEIGKASEKVGSEQSQER